MESGATKPNGQCENAEVAEDLNLLPMGLAEGCRLKRPVVKDQVLTYADVELPPAGCATAFARSKPATLRVQGEFRRRERDGRPTSC
jgi:predicted homoserine dehydrogenase-like protein